MKSSHSLWIESDAISSLIFVTCTGHPLFNLENSAHFSVLLSGSITFHLNKFQLTVFNTYKDCVIIPHNLRDQHVPSIWKLGSFEICFRNCIRVQATWDRWILHLVSIGLLQLHAIRITNFKESQSIFGYAGGILWQQKENVDLYVMMRRWRKTSIMALAMFIPRQVLPPIPKAKKLYGFDSSCPWERERERKNTSSNFATLEKWILQISFSSFFLIEN